MKKNHLRKFKGRIAGKLVIAIVLFSTMFSILTTAFQLYIDYDKEVNLIESRLQELKVSYMDGIVASLWKLDQELLKIQLKGVKGLPDIEYVEVVTDGPFKLFEGKRVDKNTIVKKMDLIYNHKGESILLGHFLVEARLDRVYKSIIDRSVIVLATNAIKTFCVSIFILILFHLLVTRHLTKIANFMRSRNEKNLSRRVKLERKVRKNSTPDELDHLVDGINSMQLKVSSMFSKLQSEMKAVLNAAPAHILLLDENFNIQFLNRSTPDHKKDDVIGMQVSTFLDAYKSENLKKFLKDAKSHKAQKSWDTSIEVKGQYKWFSFVIKPILNFGELKGFVLMVQEVSELMNLQKQLQHSSKLAQIGELAAGVGHEINNPLAISVGNVSIIRKQLQEGKIEEAIDKLDKIQTANERMREIVNGLRTFARPSNDKLETLSLNDAVLKTIRIIENLFSNENIKIQYKNDTQSDLIKGSLGRIQQVIMNLLTNARDALADVKEPIISIELKQNYGRLILKVEDNGHGIPHDIQDRIFETFYTTKPVSKGTGLGLSLTKSMVEKMDGQISFESSPGRGTSFFLNFPISHSLLNQEKDVENDTQFHDYSNLEVLIVDDESGIRELLVDVFDSFDVSRVDEAENGALALEMIKNKEYDLVLTDIKMPVMGGISLIKEVHRLNLKRNSSFIVLTGGIDQRELEFSKEVDLDELIEDYLLKPFDENDIKEVLIELSTKKTEMQKNLFSHDHLNPHSSTENTTLH